MSGSSMRKAMAQQEAKEWLEANKGWDKGMRPIKVEYAGKAAKARNVAGWSDMPWWRMDGKKVGAPAPRMEQREERRAKRPSRGCWGEQVGQPMELPAIRQVEVPQEVELQLLREGLGEYWEMQRVLRMPFGQKLKKSTWVLGEREMSAALWAEMVRCRNKKKYVKGGKEKLANKGWRREVRLQAKHAELSMNAPYGAEAKVQELAQGHVRPIQLDGLMLHVKQHEIEEGAIEPSEELGYCSPMLGRMAMQEEAEWRMERLSARQAQALRCKAEDLSRKEIAAEMSCSEERVKELLKDARKRAIRG